MNKARRQQLAQAIELLEQAKTILDDAQAAEQDAYDGLPESIRTGERGDAMQRAADALQTACEGIADAVSLVEEASE